MAKHTLKATGPILVTGYIAMYWENWNLELSTDSQGESRYRRLGRGLVVKLSRTGVQIPSTHVSSGRVWKPTDNPSIQEAQTEGYQSDTSQFGKLQFKWEILSPYVRWKVTEGNTWCQLLASMCSYMYLHTRAHTHEHTRALARKPHTNWRMTDSKQS